MLGARRTTHPRKVRSSEFGQSLAEFAIVAPIFFIVIFGAIDLSLGIKSWITVTNASREGARVLALGETCSQVTTQAQNTAHSLGSVSVSQTPSTCAGAAGDAMSVTVTYTYHPITPLGHFAALMTGPITIASTTTMRHE